MSKPKFKEPGPPGGRPRVILNAIEKAKESPGKWVLAQTYGSDATAYVTVSKLRKRFPNIEATARRSEVFVRVIVDG